MEQLASASGGTVLLTDSGLSHVKAVAQKRDCKAIQARAVAFTARFVPYYTDRRMALTH